MPVHQSGDQVMFIAGIYIDGNIGDLTIVNQSPDQVRIPNSHVSNTEIVVQLCNAPFKRIITNITNILSSYISKTYTYMDQGKTGCDLDTRVDIIDKIVNWSMDTHESCPRLSWLTGVPGSGQSSITTSITKILRDRKASIILLQLFISCIHKSTTNPSSIFPTILLQLAVQDITVVQYIHKQLNNKLTLTDCISNEKAMRLFVKPIRVLTELYPQKLVAIIIDALDESGPPSTGISTSEMITKAASSLPPNLKILLSSQSETAIQKMFWHLVDMGFVAHIDLETSNTSSIQNISKFFANEKDWPAAEWLQALCNKGTVLDQFPMHTPCP